MRDAIRVARYRNCVARYRDRVARYRDRVVRYRNRVARELKKSVGTSTGGSRVLLIVLLDLFVKAPDA